MSISNPVAKNTNGTTNGKAAKEPKGAKAAKEVKAVKASALSTDAKAASLGLKAFVSFVKADSKAEEGAQKKVALVILQAEVANAASVTGMTCENVQKQVKAMREAAAKADKADSSFRTY